MIECDAFRLLEEYIKPTLNNLPSASSLSINQIGPHSPPTTDTNDDEAEYAPSHLPIINLNLTLTEFPQKPKRPYSYYAATNLNPLDLSTFSTLTEAEHEKEENKANLSSSLSDIKSKKTKKNKNHEKSKSSKYINSEEHEDSLKPESKKYFSQNYVNMSYSEVSKPSAKPKGTYLGKYIKNQSHDRPANKVNRFIRSIFKLNTIGASQHEDESFVYEQQEPEESKTHSTFTRLFNSFRHSSIKRKPANDYTRKESMASSCSNTTIKTNSTSMSAGLIVMDEQPSKSLNLPVIQLEQAKEAFYADVAERLRRLSREIFSSLACKRSMSSEADSAIHLGGSDSLNAYLCNSSENNANTSLIEYLSLKSSDSSDIPFIDDDVESSYELSLSSKPLKVNLFPKTNYNLLSFEEGKLRALIDGDMTFAKFDEVVSEYACNYDCVWYKLTILFELVHRCAIIVVEEKYANGNGLVGRMKEIAGCYVHEKYCDWIYDQGGWVSRVFFFFKACSYSLIV